MSSILKAGHKGDKMKHFITLAILAFSTSLMASGDVPGGLPERLDCRLSSVTPKGQGAAFRRNISLVYQAYDPSLPRRIQSEFKLLPNGVGIDYVGTTAEGVQLNMVYKKGIISESTEGHLLTITESRGGGTGYGTPGFSVISRYKCR